MGVPNWGLLTKSQVDNETIEQAIARLILAHEEDETSHLDTGESLQSHKASEIIDHLAASIIEDKIGARQITPAKLYFDKYYLQLHFESLDAWDISAVGTGAEAYLESVGLAVLKTGDASGNITSISINNALIASDSSKSPYFQLMVSDDGAGDQDIAVAIGGDGVFDSDDSMFGIKYLVSSNKVIGFYVVYYDSAWHTVTVDLSLNPPDRDVWRAEYDYATKIITFYINGVVAGTIDTTDHPLSFESDFQICIANKNTVGTTYQTLWLSNFVFCQDF